MKCPQCGEEQFCPCKSCAIDFSKGKKCWIWVKGDLIKCAFCGITKHADWWMDESYKQFIKEVV